MYKETSVSLVESLQIEPQGNVVDLACGTGVTTSIILERLGETGLVWAVDSSDAMLTIARSRIMDARVRWRSGDASQLRQLIDQPVDRVACNSAIWQLGDYRSVFSVVRAILKHDGQFACNWGQGFIADTPDGSPVENTPYPCLLELARARGLLTRRTRTRLDSAPPPLPSIREIEEALESVGFAVVDCWWMHHKHSPEAAHAWWKVPAFSDWFLADVPLDVRFELVDEARALWEQKGDSTIHWFCMRARAV
jgi:trans-aconitate methyltransferase